MSASAQPITNPGATPAPGSNDLNGAYRGGPRTEAGLAASSQNAVKTALFVSGDFVRPFEEEEYAEMSERLLGELSPRGEIEHTLFEEIRSASWRLRLALNSGPVILDPMEATMNPRAEKVQNSVDRARAQANRLLKQSMSELRKLQTERQTNCELAPDDYDIMSDGLYSRREVQNAKTEQYRVALFARKLEATSPVAATPADTEPAPPHLKQAA